MKYLKTYKLITEDPDTVYSVPLGVKNPYCNDQNTYPFSMIDDKVVIGGESELHGNVEINGETLDDLSFRGRIWLDYNIISFWDKPKSRTHLYDIINQLSKLLNANLDFSKMQIDLNSETLIPISEYGDEPSENPSEEARALHLMKAKDKNKALMDSGYRSKQSKWKKYMKPFESFSPIDNKNELIKQIKVILAWSTEYYYNIDEFDKTRDIYFDTQTITAFYLDEFGYVKYNNTHEEYTKPYENLDIDVLEEILKILKKGVREFVVLYQKTSFNIRNEEDFDDLKLLVSIIDKYHSIRLSRLNHLEKDYNNYLMITKSKEFNL